MTKIENIVGDLNLILLNIPEDYSLIEKIRWIYMKVGMLFSYDYRVGDDINYALKEIDFSKNYVSRYQTCLQISYLLDLMLKQLDSRIETRIINRKVDNRGNFNNLDHHANEVILPTGEKYILDLTLDLYLIQSGCQTKHFAFENDSMSSYDILSLKEIREMDEKLNLKEFQYKDIQIKDACNLIDSMDLSDKSEKDILAIKINVINSLLVKFNGYFEGKQYINKLFLDILKMPYKEFNLTYNHNEDLEMVTCFQISLSNDDIWYIYSNKLGLVPTSILNINNMLKHGWGTKSNSLLNMISVSKSV